MTQTTSTIPLPLGPHREGTAVHFRVVTHAEQLTLGLFFDLKNPLPSLEIPLNPAIHKTGSIWHICVEDVPKGFAYGYSIPSAEGPTWLLDPYAPLTVSPYLWYSERDNFVYRPLSAVDENNPFNWEGDRPLNTPTEKTIIYEMHVRGFTKDITSRVAHPGSFLGVIEKIPHLQALGITAVELLPIMEWNEAEYCACALEKQYVLSNYWGYSTVHFLSPMNRLAAHPDLGSSLNEFKQMVKALHQAGIEVILDIVWNHTAEGGTRGPTYSLKGLDSSIYYLVDHVGNMLDYTGCGNTLQTNHPQVIDYILFCLRYWVMECHVDGFRFDLASVFHRGPQGRYINPAPIIEAMTHDPLLSTTKLIAESWDAAGLYQVGSFYKAGERWSEWNGQYRDYVRSFIKGTPGTLGIFATRLCGSQDLYGMGSPLNSVNFITAHDGFTLRDLVSYQEKHNEPNGEGNRDGHGHNESWNCGCEGPTDDPAINALRLRQMRNFQVALLLSQGIPMLHMGDEYGHTKEGNNNTWCQDNRLSWFLWNQLKTEEGLFRFTCLIIALRKKYYSIFNGQFPQEGSIIWHGQQPKEPNWQRESRFIAFQLIHHARQDLLVAFNAGSNEETWQLPAAAEGYKWHLFVHTSNVSPFDVYALNNMPKVEEPTLLLKPYSSAILCAQPI